MVLGVRKIDFTNFPEILYEKMGWNTGITSETTGALEASSETTGALEASSETTAPRARFGIRPAQIWIQHWTSLELGLALDQHWTSLEPDSWIVG